MRSSALVGGLGLLILMSGAAYHLTNYGQDWQYELTVSGNSSSGYVLSGHPNAQKRYELDDGYTTTVTFKNRTGEAIKAQIGDLELTATTHDCPISEADCRVFVPNIPNGQDRPATLQTNPDLGDADFGVEYEFKFRIGLYPEGQMTIVDPDLEIDRENLLLLLLSIFLGALLMGAGFVLRARELKKPKA